MSKRSRIGVAWFFAAAAVIAAGMYAPLSAQETSAKDVHIIFVTHGTANDVYWSVLKNGVDAGARDTGATVEYFAPEVFDVAEMAKLVDAAAAKQPDAIVFSNPDPVALEQPIKNAKAAGIAIGAIDVGEKYVKEWGLGFWIGGGASYDSGFKAGEMMAQSGAKKGICLNHEPGNTAQDLKCSGFNDGLKTTGGSSEVVAIGIDPTEAAARTEAYLSEHKDVDGILTLGPPAVPAILERLRALELIGKVKFGTFDLSPEALTAIDKGEMLFAIDNQQFMMGYLPIVLFTMKAKYGVQPTSAIYTGPLLVTKETAASVLEASKQGLR
jgi:simple sugar transport system substrate-binding protein